MTDMFPLAVVRYLAAKTPAEVADCFTEDGVATDERQTYRGRGEIRAWREAVAKISYRQDILSATQQGAQVKVACRLTGDFKGSPVNLDYLFDLSGDLVAKVEIS
ncbi:MAG: nuclear transport factor 2 family protein [Alphaproteobacteria bacterium]|nr:MAG: nuclear transport factor 2 family protein [Alphaproteobacteria bacterium]